jgi:N-acetylmuramoyl-L-alanine amidase
MPHPDRIEIELENTVKNFKMHTVKFAGSNITSMRTDESVKGLLRFIFYVKGEAHWQIKFLPQTHDVTRLLLIIQTSHKIFFKNPPLSSSKKTKKFTIVIDAGHGGKDSGALGKNGSREKDIVLSIAKKLAKKMNSHADIHAVLTRHDDNFVPLRKRLRLARQQKADLFVAIHADAYFENHATGASVYALSQHGASNEAARWLAQQSNYSELGGVSFNSLVDNDPMVRSVLVDLAQTTTMQDSLHLGSRVLYALEHVSPLHHPNVERAPFVVLKSPDIPSILVETGFITNPKEEKRLTNPVYQEKLAQALYVGINQYMQKIDEHGR